MTRAPDHAPTPFDQVDRIQRMFDGFAGVYVLNTGLKTGLFARLAAVPHSAPDELADALGLRPRYVRVWCETAYALGLLEATDDRRFRLGPYYDLLLASNDGPYEMRSAVDFYVDVIGEDFRRQPEAFRTGAVHRYQDRGAEFSAHIGVLTAAAQASFLHQALPRLTEVEARLRAGADIVDVGCGVGNLIRALAREYPASRFLGLDIDRHGIDAARARVAAGDDAGGRLRFEEAGGETLERHRAAFDIAILFQTLHEIDDAVRPSVVRALRRALRPEGVLIIVDHTYPETIAELRDPEFKMATNFEWFELLWGNRTQTRSEIDAMLADAGFAPVRWLPFPETGFQIILASPGDN